MFDGVAGFIAGRAMIHMNAEAEREAIARLDPASGSHCLVIGFGPGLGLEALLDHAPEISAVGIDPSGAMMRMARRRNAASIGEGRLTLRQQTLDQLAPSAGPFDAALAVNALQFCDPIEANAAHLATLLRPGARLMTLTHAWAFEHHFGDLDRYLGRVDAAFRAAGFDADPHFRGHAEIGTIIGFSAMRQGTRLEADKSGK